MIEMIVQPVAKPPPKNSSSARVGNTELAGKEVDFKEVLKTKEKEQVDAEAAALASAALVPTTPPSPPVPLPEQPGRLAAAGSEPIMGGQFSEIVGQNSPVINLGTAAAAENPVQTADFAQALEQVNPEGANTDGVENTAAVITAAAAPEGEAPVEGAVLKAQGELQALKTPISSMPESESADPVMEMPVGEVGKAEKPAAKEESSSGMRMAVGQAESEAPSGLPAAASANAVEAMKRADGRVQTPVEQKIAQQGETGQPVKAVPQNKAGEPIAAAETMPAPETAAAPVLNGQPSAIHSARFSTQVPSAPDQAAAAELVNQVQEHIQVSILNNRNSMRVQLSPAELGGIELRLVNSAQGLHVTVVAEQPGTSKLLEAQLDQLRQSLTDAGVQVANLNVGQHGASHQQGAWAEQQNARFSGHSYRGGAMPVEPEAKPTNLGRSQGRTASGIDYRV